MEDICARDDDLNTYQSMSMMYCGKKGVIFSRLDYIFIMTTIKDDNTGIHC